MKALKLFGLLLYSVSLSFFTQAQANQCRSSFESDIFVSREELLDLKAQSPLEITEATYETAAKKVLGYYRSNHPNGNILIFTDASWDQKSGVITVMKIIQQKVKALTGLNVIFVTPENFPLHFNTKVQDIRVAYASPGKIQALLDKYNPAAVHIMVEGSVGMAVKKVLVKNKIPFSTAYHTDFPKYAAELVPGRTLKRWVTNFGYWVLRNFHKDSEVIMSPTITMGQILKDNGFETGKIAKWSHGVELDRFTDGERDLDLFQRVLNEKQGTLQTAVKEIKRPIQLFVGRIEKEKNLEDFLQMDSPGTKVFIGDGAMRAPLQEKYPDAVFLGKMPYEELPKFYRSADVFVFTSLTDTFGLVMAEAMATGTPVLAYNIQGPIDVVTNPKAGILVPFEKGQTEKNVRQLEQGLSQALALDRQQVRSFAETMPWDRSIVEFLYFLQPLESKPE